MVITARAMKIAGMDVNITDSEADAQLAKFKDQKAVGGWAKKSAAVNVKYGIVLGGVSGYLSPMHNITRAETAAIISRTLKKANLI